MPAPVRSGQGAEVNSLLALQRTIGNQAVQRMLEPTTGDVQRDGSSSTETAHLGYDFSRIPLHTTPQVEIQPKLAIGAPGSVYGQEADHVADQVLRISEPASGVDTRKGKRFRPPDERSRTLRLLAEAPRRAAAGTTGVASRAIREE